MGRLGRAAVLLMLLSVWQLGGGQAQHIQQRRLAESTGSQHHLYARPGRQRQQLAQVCTTDASGLRICTGRHHCGDSSNGGRQALPGVLPGDCFGTAGAPLAGQLPDPPTVTEVPVAAPKAAATDASKYISAAQFQQIFKYTQDKACSPGFYSYRALRAALAAFPRFATEGENDHANRRELAAFLAHVAHETSGGWATAPGGPYAWGLCYREQGGNGPRPEQDYCIPSSQWPCAPGKTYWGRGGLQLSFNFNYGPAGRDLGVDLLNQPELVSERPVLAFKTALWLWMTPQSPKPSCHDVMTGGHVPTPEDVTAGRQLGFGWTTNIINGGVECGQGNRTLDEASRIGHFRRVAGMLRVRLGSTLSCEAQRHY